VDAHTTGNSAPRHPARAHGLPHPHQRRRPGGTGGV